MIIILTRQGAIEVAKILNRFLDSNATALEIEEEDWQRFSCVVIKNDKR